MTKKDFIVLANAIKMHNAFAAKQVDGIHAFDVGQIETLANFCQSQNANFKWGRWLAYINGECGPNGGTVK